MIGPVRSVVRDPPKTIEHLRRAHLFRIATEELFETPDRDVHVTLEFEGLRDPSNQFRASLRPLRRLELTPERDSRPLEIAFLIPLDRLKGEGERLPPIGRIPAEPPPQDLEALVRSAQPDRDSAPETTKQHPMDLLDRIPVEDREPRFIGDCGERKKIRQSIRHRPRMPFVEQGSSRREGIGVPRHRQ